MYREHVGRPSTEYGAVCRNAWSVFAYQAGQRGGTWGALPPPLFGGIGTTPPHAKTWNPEPSFLSDLECGNGYKPGGLWAPAGPEGLTSSVQFSV